MSINIKNPSLLPKDFSIFYCWQDHLEKKTHRFLIRDALNQAIERLQDEIPEGVECVLRSDSDTSGRAGAVEIADAICEKIRASTIVVADITPVISGDGNRKYPNPNVMLEVGYAASAIGWHRVIAVFNRAACDPEDLPFDVRHRRVTPYRCASVPDKKSAMTELANTLYHAISGVISDISSGKEVNGKPLSKRMKDLRLLREVFASLNTDAMDRYIEMGLYPERDDQNDAHYLAFSGIVSASRFQLYDKKLMKLIDDVSKLWRRTVSLSSIVFFREKNGRLALIDGSQWSDEYREKVGELVEFYRVLHRAWRSLIEFVHQNYPEVELGQEAQSDFLRASIQAHSPPNGETNSGLGNT